LRHPEIRTNVSRITEASRIRQPNNQSIAEFYKSLKAIREAKKIKAENEYNMDETGV